MKSFFAASILVLMFCIASFAQPNETVPCPEIDVIGPSGIVESGEIARFTAVVKDNDSENYNYKWTITGGIIIEEKGSEQIDLGTNFESKGANIIKILLTPETAGQTLSATVEVKGLSEGCPNIVSEALVCTLRPNQRVIDEFSVSVTRIDKAKLDGLAKELQNEPSAQIYIIEKFKENVSRKSVERKNQMIIDFLKTQGIEREWVTLLNAFDKENLTRFILVPAGASSPTCEGCITVKPK